MICFVHAISATVLVAKKGTTDEPRAFYTIEIPMASSWLISLAN
jgi:hypothetical protein